MYIQPEEAVIAEIASVIRRCAADSDCARAAAVVQLRPKAGVVSPLDVGEGDVWICKEIIGVIPIN
jgi:hypothetical protein